MWFHTDCEALSRGGVEIGLVYSNRSDHVTAFRQFTAMRAARAPAPAAQGEQWLTTRGHFCSKKSFQNVCNVLFSHSYGECDSFLMG